MSATKSLRLLTFNVWFRKFNFEARCKRIIEIIKDRADVACLQEVTPDFVRLMQADKEFVETFHVSSNRLNRYGIKILVRKSLFPSFVPEFQEVKLPSRMARSLLTTVIRPMDLVIATVHLESLDSRVTREHQLKIIASNLKTHEEKGLSALLCGDFNICSRRNFSSSYKTADDGTDEKDLENSVVDRTLPHYDDAWVMMMSDKEPYGFTMDSARNPNIVNSEGRGSYCQYRLDRIMLNLSVSIIPSSYSLVGTERINNSFCPSDHFGLTLRLDHDTELAAKLRKSKFCVSSQVCNVRYPRTLRNLTSHFNTGTPLESEKTFCQGIDLQK